MKGNISHLLLSRVRDIVRFCHKKLPRRCSNCKSRLRAKTNENNVEVRRTSYLTTLTSHRSFHSAEILLASTTRSHWDAKVIYSSDRWWEEAMTSTIDNVYLKVRHIIRVQARTFCFYYLPIYKNLWNEIVTYLALIRDSFLDYFHKCIFIKIKKSAKYVKRKSKAIKKNIILICILIK